MLDLQLIPPMLGVVGLVVAVIIYFIVKSYDEGDEKLKKIADQIHLGAMVFMRREYTMLSMFAAAILVAIYLSPLGWMTAVAFVAGAVSSAAAGWFGMFTATKANVRTTQAAHNNGQASALTVAFFGGSIMGLAVASLGLLGLGIVYLLFGG
ncbi:MAG: sodium-translocating pyrophosphatase, partial [Porticoccaceae bacterium]|nr:sodium-translocating pyrophosphatase [Porticoccaceae bacterium]